MLKAGCEVDDQTAKPRQNTISSRTNNAAGRKIAVEANGKHNRNPNDALKH